MSTTANDIFLKVRALLDELTDDGVLTSDDDVADIREKTIKFLDMGQKELYSTGKLYKKFEYTNVPYDNALGNLSNFDIVEYEGVPQYYTELGVVAKAYYFEVDGEATVKIQELEGGSWVDLITVSVPNTVTSMTAYKGVISTTTQGNLVRMVFDGTYYYKHQNRAFYAQPFSVSRIPDYRPYIKVQMPTDFRSTDTIIEETSDFQYIKSANYKWEGFKDLYVSYEFVGTVRVIYKPVPTSITTINDVLEIDDITAQALAYYCAAKIAPYENKSVVSFFQQEFERLKFDSMKVAPQEETIIENAYGW